MLAQRYPIAHRLYPYQRSADQNTPRPVRHTVAVIGGGPVGMAAALDLALKGIEVVVLDDHEGIGQGSRAICFSKRSLEIAHRLGVSAPMMAKGVEWNLGKVFHGDRLVFEFNLLPEEGHRFPAFINLQQPYFEKFLVDRICEARHKGAPVEIRGGNRVDAVRQRDDGVELDITTPGGSYTIEAGWAVVADGAGSPTRKAMGLSFDGEVFEDNFLIADVRMDADFPTERRFWFEPPFVGAGDSALLHKQPDGEWRIDFQIGWNIDRKHELEEQNVRRRLDAMLGPIGIGYEIIWTSIYTFQCRRMQRFRHERIIFVGDSCHQVSPFGARGCNGGLQDIDNLGWKLARVIEGHSPQTLLDSYDSERAFAADENIRNSSRATDFITPKSGVSKVFRNAVLNLAQRHDFARQFVNSGRLSIPAFLDGSSLSSKDELPNAPACSRPGAVCPDAPLDGEFLLNLLGNGFALLYIGAEAPAGSETLGANHIAVPRGRHPQLDERYLGLETQGVYLIRPDQHVAGRWSRFDLQAVRAALHRACGITG
ncbi:FAD-dependent oxidoreductase [Mesorhizobium sp. CO1-1-8]|uniref:FAD-dependent oxidoreductase n=1 Tax=Mesorhizobium sp. CO1-1-8 TaxID=2876631 RepID=UPI001CD13C2D|nr:FAD-dependent oxidoreductase [Mesorhizobium sp. CO1-1-8]MBZ9772397.1 FAD-dependent oxidoreductase [Mesorhizobium sp. CO1-1-8]